MTDQAALAPVKIVPVAPAGLLHGIVAETFEREEDMAAVAKVSNASALRNFLRQTAADVVGRQVPRVSAAGMRELRLSADRPALKVLGFEEEEENRQGSLCVPRPSASPLGDVSPRARVETIRRVLST